MRSRSAVSPAGLEDLWTDPKSGEDVLVQAATVSARSTASFHAARSACVATSRVLSARIPRTDLRTVETGLSMRLDYARHVPGNAWRIRGFSAIDCVGLCQAACRRTCVPAAPAQPKLALGRRHPDVYDRFKRV